MRHTARTWLLACVTLGGVALGNVQTFADAEAQVSGHLSREGQVPPQLLPLKTVFLGAAGNAWLDEAGRRFVVSFESCYATCIR